MAEAEVRGHAEHLARRPARLGPWRVVQSARTAGAKGSIRHQHNELAPPRQVAYMGSVGPESMPPKSGAQLARHPYLRFSSSSDFLQRSVTSQAFDQKHRSMVHQSCAKRSLARRGSRASKSTTPSPNGACALVSSLPAASLWQVLSLSIRWMWLIRPESLSMNSSWPPGSVSFGHAGARRPRRPSGRDRCRTSRRSCRPGSHRGCAARRRAC